MNINSTIDWVSYTVKNVAPNQLPYPDYCRSIGHDALPSLGYTMAFALDNGIRVLSNPDRPEMGYHIIISGKALSTLYSAGFEPQKLLQDIAKIGGRFKRIDLATDFRNTELTVEDFASAFRNGQAQTTARNFKEIKGAVLPSDGHTIYLGSRQSERMARVYDKAAEQGLSSVMSWVRFEVELKGSKAHGVANYLADQPQKAFTKAIHAAILDFIDFPTIPEWKNALQAVSAEIGLSEAKDRDTKKWLIQSCARALAKVVVRQDENFLEKFMMAFDEWTDYYQKRQK